MHWNQFRRDRRNSGARGDLESPPRPEVAWSVDLEGTAADPPVLDRDAVYVGTEAGAYAYDRHAGRYRWAFRTDSAVLPPVLAGDTLAIVTRDGSVCGLEAGTGEERWRERVPTPVASPAAYHDGRVYVGHAGGVSAFAIETGERVRECETDAETVGAPAIHDGRVYVGTRDDEVLAFDLDPTDEAGSPIDDGDSERGDGAGAVDANGTAVDDEPGDANEGSADGDEPIWRAPIEGAIAGGPTIVPGDGGARVYVADAGGLALAMDATTGQSWFTYEIDDAFATAPTVVADSLFVAADDGYLHVTDTQFGTRKVRGWLFAKKGIGLDGVATAQPALVGGTLCLGDSTGAVYGIDIAELDFAWYVPLEAPIASGPAVAEDGLYVGTDDGRLVRLAWNDDSAWQ